MVYTVWVSKYQLLKELEYMWHFQAEYDPSCGLENTMASLSHIRTLFQLESVTHATWGSCNVGQGVIIK